MGCVLSEPRALARGESKGSPYWVQARTKLANLKTFSYEFCGGIFTGFKNQAGKLRPVDEGKLCDSTIDRRNFRRVPHLTHYLVKQGEPIPLKLLRKTHVTVGAVRPKRHPISGELINYGQVPFGYKDINGTLHKDPLEQFVLQSIKRMRNEGASLNRIASYLTTSGVPTKNGGRWQSNTVNKILNKKA